MHVSHRGAAALAPPNSLDSIRSALALGTEMIEFDVALHAGALVLAHERPGSTTTYPSLEEAFSLIADAPGPPKVQIDVKWPGYEREVAHFVRRWGFVERALISTTFRSSAAALHAACPDLHVALSYPADRYGVSRFSVGRPAVALAAGALRSSLPLYLRHLLRGLDLAAVMLNHLVISRAVVRQMHARRIAVFAWTADDVGAIRRLMALSVDGIITNDPRLFAVL